MDRLPPAPRRPTAPDARTGHRSAARPRRSTGTNGNAPLPRPGQQFRGGHRTHGARAAVTGPQPVVPPVRRVEETRPGMPPLRTGARNAPVEPPTSRIAAAGPARQKRGQEQKAPAGRAARPRTAAAAAAAQRRGKQKQPEAHLVRRGVLAVLAGSLVMFGVASLDMVGTSVPVLSSLASLPGPDVREVPPPPATPGTCLTWTRPDAADTEAIDCAQPHLFEQAGSVTLADQTNLPDDRTWRQLVNERCQPVVLDYLGGKFDPDGKFRIGALKPSPDKWAEGDHALRCGLQSASRSGQLFPITGKVADSDQSDVQEPGTCLAIDGRTIGDPTDCAGQHAVETVGIVDLSKKFDGGFPKVGDQDGFLQPECVKVANEYAGGAEVIAAKKLTVYWDNITESSWNAGSRRVNCNLAALLPDRSGFAPVTGPVKGDVVVGDQPAQPKLPNGEYVPPPAADLPPAEQHPEEAEEGDDGQRPDDAEATQTPPASGAPTATPAPGRPPADGNPPTGNPPGGQVPPTTTTAPAAPAQPEAPGTP